MASLHDDQPTTNKTAKIFLGLCTVYRTFVEALTGLEYPLNKILKKERQTILRLTTNNGSHLTDLSIRSVPCISWLYQKKNFHINLTVTPVIKEYDTKNPQQSPMVNETKSVFCLVHCFPRRETTQRHNASAWK